MKINLNSLYILLICIIGFVIVDILFWEDIKALSDVGGFIFALEIWILVILWLIFDRLDNDIYNIA